ncbi:MAG: glycerol-3-phosphate dehydrogenase [Microbacterium sp. 14-71-5]|jgi:glycerol-3-phosphate dehydrogenase|uniref:glycerol-3-phosphate dehydrogenase/oxidase n=1 Tax=Microbacterium sp. 13-71-7 TaxID=1970399 RepID=UPI000BCC7C48|nr:glycerol-3-phosphate dehydrogenase/oxidase [Microbacterium sp. 13-71-7]OZB78313.1 MAG: glycerol-3-phosphate dehydrogenase [Microbacterium sp. 14-71-5]OZB84644.1 MAG: glycerol-3-phosphate dehydrogenase [Microbacterium sp. 13-71-7]
MRGSSRLTAARREQELLRSAAERVDLLVVGGGITGTGVALDAASRGLSVVLVEAEDLAYGTSRFSSKLVHGGLRYLATGDVATARESAIERHLLMTRIAPHLIRPMAQLLPFSPAVTMAQRATGAVGFALGDLLRLRAGTPHAVLPAPRIVSARTAARLTPSLRTDRLRGAVLAADGQLVDDARLVIAVARTAAAFGARILTRVRALGLRHDGASVEDALTGELFDIRARAVVNATGVWAGALDDAIRMRPSRGTHLVLDAAALGDPAAALTVPHPGSISRFVFALPQQLGRVVVGLTDEDAPGPVPSVAAPTEPEIAFLLEVLNRALRTPIRRDQVRGAYAGLRPLVDTGGTSTADISRRHLVAVSEGGFVNVLGGKLTTYRRMAEDAVDRAVALASLPAAPCRTAALPLVGALASPHRPTSDLDWRYGAEAGLVLARARCADPREPIADGIDVTRAEVEFAVRAEGALTADDVLDRRTRIGLVDDDRLHAQAAVAQLVAETRADPD